MWSGRTLKAYLTAGVVLTWAAVAYGQQTSPAGRPVPTSPSRAPSQWATSAEPAPVAPLMKPAQTCEPHTLALPATAKDIRQGLKPRERVVVVQVLCVQLPSGFCDKAGLTPEALTGSAGAQTSHGGTWTLTPREARMLTALIAAEPDKEVLCRPQLALLDGQTGSVQCGQPVVLVTALEAATKDGATVYTLKTATFDVGTALKVTPTTADGGRSVRLRVCGSHTTLGGTPVRLPVAASQTDSDGVAGVQPVAFLQCVGQAGLNVQAVETTLNLAAGATAVVRGPVVSAGKRTAEMLWVLTAHVVEGAKAAGCCAGDR